MSEALPRSSGWMVSPTWDLAFIIASPVLIVPALWLLTRTTITPEQLAVPVFAFATLGHHLPGYMRAYGDRALFRRFRTRFVVVPPLLFGVVLFLVQPSLFGVGAAPFATVQLLMVVWGAWHGLMQIYGFMRIYDAKQGIGHGRSQRLDLAVCFAIFIAGFLFSDARMFMLLDLGWRSGVPAVSVDVLAAARMLGAVAIAVLAGAYVLEMAARRRRGHRMGVAKLCLAVATGGIYTWSGLVTTDVLLGAAVFEVFHALQYLAIVWYFNRRLEDRVGESFGPLRFLFRNRWSSLGLYLVSVAAFGALFLEMGTPRYGPIVSSGAATDRLYVLFSAFFVTSSLLHYYYDGFIWKLHDRQTGRNLGVTGPGLADVSVPALKHFARWSLLAGVVGILCFTEASQPASEERYEAHMLALAALTPDVPEMRARLIRIALEDGRVPDALEMAERNVALRPRSHHVRADLARVHVVREDWKAAEASYRAALDLSPGEVVYTTDLARVLTRQGPARREEAVAAYRDALEAQPDDTRLKVELASLEAEAGRPSEAAHLLRDVLTASPDALEVRARLVASLSAAGESKEAIRAAREGVARHATSGAAHRLLGSALLARDRAGPAADALLQARELDPTLAGLDLELGEALLRADRHALAEQALARAADAEPVPARVFALQAALYARTSRPELAREARDRFVAAAPDPATGQRALGLQLASLDDLDGAVTAFREALRIAPGHRPTRARLETLLRRNP